ncbi:MAG: rRNA cytosine-C5-methyltransferase [Phocaeicola sp.]|nr:rRNA cytosine-C5-methyltransferase [Phocaeicola sp.]MDY3914045.1 rRNA cytosine-C5-methyltransferase [Phocaeicola sp.]MDY5939864.1 rRNA cytosine-C5-methyltransferase [Phocaeicola sp.]
MNILPAAFREEILHILPVEEANALFQTIESTTAPTSIRLNPSKAQSVVAPSEKVSWFQGGYYLNERPSFTFDPLFHAGLYYVQEASSMFLAQAIRSHLPKEASCVLDLCAAPGGKSTLLRQILPDNTLLVANEFIRNRAQILSENLQKWGNPHVVCTSNAPADFTQLPAVFDAIVADVPCSGEGMFRKDPQSISEWSPQNVSLCIQRQRDIISHAWQALKPNGLLFYSTCTYNREENEQNVAWICKELGGEVLAVPTIEAWGITGNLSQEDFPIYRFFPHKTKGEGFFLAVLRKAASGEHNQEVFIKPNKKEKNKEKPMATPAILKKWLKEEEKFMFKDIKGTFSAIPTIHEPLYQSLTKYLYILHAGIPMACQKGKDLIPQQGLALSTSLSDTAFPYVELSYEKALTYLRKESFQLPEEVSKGFVLATYQGKPLGFLKNLGNRANNLYPNEWKIKSTTLNNPVQVVL